MKLNRIRRRVAVAGIDPSLSSTGMAFEGGTDTFENYRKGMDRIVYILSRIEKRLVSEKITHAAIEGYFIMPGRLEGALGMAELAGTIKLLLLARGIPTIVVPPTALKKYVTGKGNASKPEVMLAIKKRWGKSFTQSDRADAYGLMRFGQDWFSGHEGVRKTEFRKVEQLTPNSDLQSIALSFLV